MSREMKDSGIEWIGQIPKEWKVNKIGNLYQVRNEKVSDKDYPPLSVTMNGIVPQLETAAKTNNGDDRKLVCKGDFAINSRSDRRGSCGVSQYDGSVSLINTILKPRGSMNSQYYNWLFHTELFADEFYKWGHGIVDDLWTTRWQEMKNISIVYPSLQEQQKIADYLDKVCGEVDEMVALQEKMIEELKAYKQSIITEAVTKGLNPNVPMKDSGIDWIGEVPDEWRIISLQSLSESIRNGYVGPTRDLFKDEGIRYIQSLHLKDGVIDFDRHHYYVSEEWANQHPKIHKDDLLIVQTGDIGQVAIVPKEYDDCNCHALIIVVLKQELCLPTYISYYLRSTVGKELLLKCKTGALLPHLNSGKIGVTPITLPSKDEQQSIASYLDTKCVEIDALIAIKQAKIEELKDYKKSVIYEYVTGKKEVV